MTVESGALWYAVHTHPHEELKAFGHLQRQHYQVYLPRYTAKVRHARKSVRVVRPFFPRYLFIRLNLRAQGWRPIRSTIGVTDIVCFSDQPSPLPCGIIEALQIQEDADGFIKFVDQKSFKPGDSVAILTGPFAHHVGRCDRASDDERVAVLLDLLGRKVRVVLDVEAVQAA